MPRRLIDQTELFPGQSAQATAAVEPADADNPNVAWASSDDAVATVDADGKVTAIAAGTASITATTEEGGFTASADVTVKADNVKALAVAAAPTKVDYLQGDAIDLTGGKLTVTYEQAGDVEMDMAQANAIVDMNQVGEAVPVAIEFGGQKLENAFTINIKAATVTALELIDLFDFLGFQLGGLGLLGGGVGASGGGFFGSFSGGLSRFGIFFILQGVSFDFVDGLVIVGTFDIFPGKSRFLSKNIKIKGRKFSGRIG